MRRFLTFCGIAVGGILAPARARADIRPYGTLDLFLPANAAKGLAGDTQAAMGYLAGLGYSSTASIVTKSAVGGRIGLLFGVTDGFGIGLSAGYLSGPNSKDTIKADGGALTGVLTDTRQVSFIRGLLEPTLKAQLAEGVFLRLAGGAGVAQGKVHETLNCAGNACKVQGDVASGSSTWAGPTWEVSSSISLGPGVLGLRYARFPTFKGNSNNSKIEWSSTGLFAGIAF